MGKFDGMDPELVRDLLSEVKQAAGQMRTIESRVAQLMGGAGLSSGSAQRPSQTAEACDAMVKDVSARVALLEKKVKQETTSAAPNTRADDPSPTPTPTPTPEPPKADDSKPEAPSPEGGNTPTPTPETPKGEDAKPEAPKEDAKPQPPKAEDLKPAVPDSEGRTTPAPTPTPEPPKADDSTPQPPKPEDGITPTPEPPKAEDPTPPPKEDDSTPQPPKAEDLKPAVPDSEGNPRIEDQPSGTPDAPAPETDRSPETDPRPDPSPDTGSTPSPAPETGTAPDPKPDTDSKGDERSPRDGGSDSPQGAGDGPLDTPEKNHPDDIDQTGDLKPQVVEVDGVKVLQIPLDPPTAEQVEALLEDIENIPPMDMPTVDGLGNGSGTNGTGTDGTGTDGTGTDGTGAGAGQVDPSPALDSARPQDTVLDTAAPAPDQTVQPPGTGTGQDGTGTGDSSTQGNPGGQTDSGAQGSGAQQDSVARWADDGSDVVSVEVSPPSAEALKTLIGNVREIEPLDMPSVQVPEGETWGEGRWAPMDVGPDGPAGEVDPGEPRRPIPPPGGSSGA
ncbi:hypothetical protein Psi01_06770 [Planobispora siamensis]|uniref:Uncharacterized protein n=1 Tax=Planobispora siamensis TaxID=936338 RepID=A0A8J3WIS0_9ACTN|nr:hypothetical protein [Planobispora siamensis]GIH90047.1 hypothetical protein Psi01_06770 [Planobispora siamensis]